jgi:hypothetical protein
MNLKAHLLSFAALLPSGMVSPLGRTPWKSGQAGPDGVERSQVLDRPYPGYGKLSLADRLAFGVASLLFRACKAPAGGECGVCLGIAAGSLSIDLRYWESVLAGFPSPGLFAATLPSSPVSDVAIFHGLTGPNRIVSGGSASGIKALFEALTMLHRGKAPTMLAVALSAIEPGDRRISLKPPSLDTENRAFAFLLSSKKTEAGAATRIAMNRSAPVPGSGHGDCLDSLTEMLFENRYGSIEYAVEDECGFFSIEKDL